MIKILHSADWHLDAPLTGRSAESTHMLRQQLNSVPEKIADICTEEKCDILLLSGDLFDGKPAKDTVSRVQEALGRLHAAVFIAPGNHDYIAPDSPYCMDGWPENVHIFRQQQMESVSLPQLNCKIYGAGYTAMDCPALLQGFQATGEEKWHIGVLHGQVDSGKSPYCCVTREQLKQCGLSYLALGHIHASGSVRSGDTLCAWPGCPMGRGFDETGEKCVLLVTLDDEVTARLRPLDTPRFYDEQVDAGLDPVRSLRAVLPELPTSDHYRVTLTGYSTGIDVQAIYARFPHIPNLTVRDATIPETQLWSSVGEDTLEGVYFELLQQASLSENGVLAEKARLAARISRQILDGQEVTLP